MVSIWLTKVKGRKELADMKKIGLAGRGRFSSNALVRKGLGLLKGAGLLAILLDPCGTEPGEAVLVDRELPGEKLVDRQRVAAAGFFEREQPAANRGDDFGLTANDPPFGPGRGQVRNRKWAAVRPDDVFHPRAMGFCHGVLTNS